MLSTTLRLTAAAAIAASLAACVSPYDPGGRALVGAGIGGATGAGIGALAGGGQGAIVGGVVGAAGGAIVGAATTPRYTEGTILPPPVLHGYHYGGYEGYPSYGHRRYPDVVYVEDKPTCPYGIYRSSSDSFDCVWRRGR